MNLDEKVLDVIKQGLPEATVEAFKERIEELEHLANQVPSLKKTISVMREDFTTLKKERDILKSYENSLGEIKSGVEFIKTQKLELELREEVLKVRIELMNTRVLDHKEMFNVVFRNPTLRTEIFTNKSKNDKLDYNKGTTECNSTTISKSEE